MACEGYQKKFNNEINSLSKEFQRQVSLITAEAERDAEELEDEAPEGVEVVLGVDIKVDSIVETWSLHLPHIKLVDKKLGSLHVPEVTLRDKDIIFHTPSTRMVLKVTGRYPEVKCTPRGIHTSCKTVWKEIKTHVPEVFMQEQKIRMGIPEVTMKQQDVIVGLPELDWKLTEIKFDVPTIKIERVEVRTREMEKKAKQIKRDTERKVETEKAEYKAEFIQNVTPLHTSLFDCIKDNAAEGFDVGIVMINGQIEYQENTLKDLRAKNIPADHEAYKQIESAKRKLLEQKIETEKERTKVIQDIEESQETSLKDLLDAMK